MRKKMDDIIFLFAFSSISLYSGIILFLVMHSILFYTSTTLQWMIIRFTRYNVTYLTREPVVRLWMDAFSPRTVEIRICLLKRWIRTYLLNADTDLCPKWFLIETLLYCLKILVILIQKAKSDVSFHWKLRILLIVRIFFFLFFIKTKKYAKSSLWHCKTQEEIWRESRVICLNVPVFRNF